jgi:hypothetical protein
MDLRRWLSTLAACVSLAASAGCDLQKNLGVTAPSATVDAGLSQAAAKLLGTWNSQAAADLGSCTNFQWVAAAQTPNDVSGQFSATCLGAVPLTGTATGTLTSPTTIVLAITAAASVPGLGPCNLTLTSNGTFDGDAIHAPYTGSSCFGPFSGTATLHKSDLTKPTPAPAPEPDPVPTPAPAPAPDPIPPPAPPAAAPEPWEACAAFVDNKDDLVHCVHDATRPGSSGALAFEVVKRVAWLLRGEGGGLLIKDSGENIIFWKGQWFSISRMCYPDGHIFKVISDAGDGGTNGPSWSDNGFVDPSKYVPAIDPR